MYLLFGQSDRERIIIYTERYPCFATETYMCNRFSEFYLEMVILLSDRTTPLTITMQNQAERHTAYPARHPNRSHRIEAKKSFNAHNGRVTPGDAAATPSHVTRVYMESLMFF